MLGHYHTLDFSDDGGVVQVFKDGKTIRRQAKSGLGEFIRSHPLTTANIIACLEDLKVLGKADYKALLKWRHMLRNAIRDRKDMKEKEKEKETAAKSGDGDEEEVTTSEGISIANSAGERTAGDDMKDMELALSSTQKRIAQRRKREEKKRRRQHAKLQHRIDQKTAGLGGAVVQEDPLV